MINVILSYCNVFFIEQVHYLNLKEYRGTIGFLLPFQQGRCLKDIILWTLTSKLFLEAVLFFLSVP